MINDGIVFIGTFDINTFANKAKVFILRNSLNRKSHIIITSPPYWQLKDYGAKDQIGFNDSYQDYIDNLNKVWKESHRVLHPGCRLCVNIGDQFAG